MTKAKPDPNSPPEEGKGKKLSETLDSLTKKENIESLVGYAKSNTRDTIAYILMILGLVILFFHPIYGGLLIGIITGFYFSSEILAIVKNLNDFIEQQGMVRSLILGGAALGFFILAPGIYIGIAVIIGIKQLILLGDGSDKKG